MTGKSVNSDQSVESTYNHSVKFLSFIFVVGVIIGVVLLWVFIKGFAKVQEANTKSDYEPTITHPVSSKDFGRTSLVDACQIEGDCLESVVLFQGYISGKSANDFIKFIETHPETKTVCVNSGGGETEPALKMSKLIADKGLVTCMADYYKVDESKSTVLGGGICSSSCNMLLLSSAKRIMNGLDIHFRGHGFAHTTTAEFPGFYEDWSVKSTVIVEPVDFASALNHANTPDKEEHFNYIKLVKDISHLKPMKTLSSTELTNYRIFTHRIVDNALVKL